MNQLLGGVELVKDDLALKPKLSTVYPMSLYKGKPENPEHKIVHSREEEELYEAAGFVNGHEYYGAIGKAQKGKK